MNLSSRRMAISATLHCLSGCAIGEVAGMVIGSLLNISSLAMVALSVALAFIFGYSFTAVPLFKGGLSLRRVLALALAADSLSILTMEVVDNGVMLVIPGAINASLYNPLFWVSLAASLFIAFWAAVPVNEFLLQHGQGHALVHNQHHH